jgi:hypothetical protein
MSIQTTPPLTNAELERLLGGQEEVSQYNEELNITITTLKVPDGYQQVFTKVEDGKTTTLVRTYHDAVETEEDVEEEVEEIEVDEEQLSMMRSSVTTTSTTTTETNETSSSTTKKKKSKKSKTTSSEPEGETSVVEEPFPGGHKEITTLKFPDGTYKTSTKIFYDDQHLIESKKEETTTTTTEETTTKGKKKKSKKNQSVQQSNVEVISTSFDEVGNEIIVTRERFENGYKDTTTTKFKDGTYKATTQITYYPVEKEIIETTEIVEKEPASIRLVERSYVTDQNKVVQEEEEYNQESVEVHEKHEKTEKVKKKKKTLVEQNSVENNENAIVEKKVVKKTKKTTDEQKAAILKRDESEGVVTVTTEEIEGGYREIRKTTFSDGSSKTEVKEHYTPVEEQITFDTNALKKLPKVTKKPKEIVNADGSKSTIVVEKIEGGVRETTTTIHLDGRIKTSTREYYEPKEEQVIMDEEAIKNIPKVTDKPQEIINADGSKTTVTVEKIEGGIREITTTVHTNGRVKQSMREFYDATPVEDEPEVTEEKKKMGSILQKRELYQNATKTTKEEKVHTNATFQSRIRSN